MTNMTNEEMETYEAAEAAKPKTETYTIRVTFKNKKEAAWIHEAMKDRTPRHGVKVTAISNGDMFTELSLRENEVDILEGYANPIISDGDHEKIKWINDAVEDAGMRYQ